MSDHIWTHTGRRRTVGKQKVTVYECRTCETEVEVLDCELAVEAAQSKGVEMDCDLVVVRQVMGT